MKPLEFQVGTIKRIFKRKPCPYSRFTDGPCGDNLREIINRAKKEMVLCDLSDVFDERYKRWEYFCPCGKWEENESGGRTYVIRVCNYYTSPFFRFGGVWFDSYKVLRKRLETLKSQKPQDLN